MSSTAITYRIYKTFFYGTALNSIIFTKTAKLNSKSLPAWR